MIRPAQSRLPGRRARVLLVDDDLLVLLSLRRVLERGGGFDVVLCSSGLDALTLIERGKRFDVLITDLAMPDLRGSELLLRIAALDPGLAARALVLTGEPLEDAVSELRASAGVRMMAKPFDLARLCEVVDALALLAAGPPDGGTAA